MSMDGETLQEMSASMSWLAVVHRRARRVRAFGIRFRPRSQCLERMLCQLKFSKLPASEPPDDDINERALPHAASTQTRSRPVPRSRGWPLSPILFAGEQ
eukprot:scaffold69281_cov26-Tisochrysis_lutea.AAC.3